MILDFFKHKKIQSPKHNEFSGIVDDFNNDNSTHDLSISSLNISLNTLKGYEFKYVKFQTKIGNLFHNGKFGFCLNNDGETTTIHSYINCTPSTITTNDTNNMYGLASSLKFGLVQNISRQTWLPECFRFDRIICVCETKLSFK